jgi:hypothetical protein
MRLHEFVVEGKVKKKEEKPDTRNYVAKNAPKTGAGSHEDKKKAIKAGKEKHKGKEMVESITYSPLEYQLLETRLIETVIDTVKIKGVTYQWVSEPGYDAVISNSPQPDKSISLHVMKMGDHKEIAGFWHRLKEKYSTPEKSTEKPPMPQSTNPYEIHKRHVGEDATAGATSSANIASVPNPHLTVGNSNKAYTGSPGKSGTKRPVQPKMQMQKPGTNALDSNNNIFGSGALKRSK